METQAQTSPEYIKLYLLNVLLVHASSFIGFSTYAICVIIINLLDVVNRLMDDKESFSVFSFTLYHAKHVHIYQRGPSTVCCYDLAQHLGVSM